MTAVRPDRRSDSRPALSLATASGAVSSAGQSASLTPRMSGVRVPHRPPPHRPAAIIGSDGPRSLRSTAAAAAGQAPVHERGRCGPHPDRRRAGGDPRRVRPDPGRRGPGRRLRLRPAGASGVAPFDRPSGRVSRVRHPAPPDRVVLGRRSRPSSARVRFVHLDVRNARYNPHGTLDATEVTFPTRSAATDLLRPVQRVHPPVPRRHRALPERIRRVLRPGGSAVTTWFLLDPARIPLAAAPDAMYPMVHVLDATTRYSDARRSAAGDRLRRDGRAGDGGGGSAGGRDGRPWHLGGRARPDGPGRSSSSAARSRTRRWTPGRRSRAWPTVLDRPSPGPAGCLGASSAGCAG